jgi:hypothetical protein
MSYAKTAIYPNSLILEGEGLSFLRKKKGRMKNLPFGLVGPVHHEGSGGGGGSGLIF